MKKRFTLLLLTFGISLYVASQSICNTPTLTTRHSLLCKTRASLLEEEDTMEYYLRVYFHVIRKSDGTGGQNDQVLSKAIRVLNADFNPYSIYFVWDGWIDYINNSYFYFTEADENYNTIFSTNNHQDGIDVYFFPDENSYNGGLANGIGVSSEYLISGVYWKDLSLSISTSHVVSHEMGHVLSLYHTHHGTYYNERGIGDCAELVDGSNSSVCGDFIEDTPADPNLNYNVDPVTFAWNGYGIDENGDAYNPNVRLIMSYTDIRCMSLFTPMQARTMKYSINNLPFLQNAVIAIMKPSLNGDTILCGQDLYTLNGIPNYMSVSWSIDSNSFSIYPSGNQCQVTYNDTLQYHVAHLTAAITLNGDTIATKSKRIVHHGSNLFVQGWQDEAITMNGTCPERTFTFPSDQYPEEEEEEDLSPGDGDGGLREITTPTRRPLWRVRRRADLAVGEGLDEVHYVYENINPNGGLRSGSLGYRDINGGNEVGLYSTFFDGMDISFYGANAPTAYRKVGNYVYFTMPYETDPYYVRLEAHSGGGCNDFELLFRVVPLESGEITGDPQLFVEYDGTYLRVVPEMDIEEPGNGQVTIPQWTLSIVNVSTGLVVYSQVINDIEAYVNVSGWPSGIYGINASSQSFSYNKRIRF